MTFNPGQWPYQAAKHCECCAATPAAQPLGPLKKKDQKNAFEDQIRSFSLLFVSHLNTIGILTVPPDM